MASGNIEKRGDQCYRLRITRIDPLTKKRIVYRETLHCPLKEAQRVLRERLAEIEQTGNVVRTPVTTLEDYLTRWLAEEASLKCKSSTIQISQNYLRLYVNAKGGVGSLLLSQATTARLQEHFAWLHQKKKLSALTVRRVATIVSAALTAAVKKKLLPQNPMRGVTLPQVPKSRRRRTLRPEEAQAFVKALLEDRLGLLFEIMLFAALRPGEATGLLWPAVNWEEGVLHIETSLTRLKEGKWEITDPKTEGSSRSIPLPPHLLSRLRLHKEQQDLERAAMGEAWVGTEPFVFCTNRGTPLNPRNLKSRHFRPILERAGLNPKEFRGFYSLRHSSATLLLVKNAHPKVMAERLGHSSTRVTMEVYSHVIKGMQEEASGTLDQLIYGVESGHALGTGSSSGNPKQPNGSSNAKRLKPHKT